MAYIGHEKSRGTLKYRCPARHGGWKCPSEGRCNTGKKYGKTVRVKGLVVDVCTARGCWLELAGDRPHERIRVKVEDGAIVFPASARGRQAEVQGVVEVMRMCPDEALRFRRNEAREKGVPFDPASITGKETALSIQATGAVIE